MEKKPVAIFWATTYWTLGRLFGQYAVTEPPCALAARFVPQDRPLPTAGTLLTHTDTLDSLCRTVAGMNR